MYSEMLEERDCDERIWAEQVKSTRGDLGDTVCKSFRILTPRVSLRDEERRASYFALYFVLFGVWIRYSQSLK